MRVPHHVAIAFVRFGSAPILAAPRLTPQTNIGPTADRRSIRKVVSKFLFRALKKNVHGDGKP